MHVIRKEDELAYSLLMDKIAYCGYFESGKAVKSMNLDIPPTDLRELSEAIGMPVGQVVLDKLYY
jgi:hypothetical protein